MTDNRTIGEGATTLDMLYHNYPWLKTLMMRKERQLDAAKQALEYISQPTMSYDNSMSPEEFVENSATPKDIKLALITCIQLAQRTKEAIGG
ncbi:MAG: hypothetical protein V3T23_08435 [Nitrososphaerales archaeon]